MKQLHLIGTTGNNLCVVQIPTGWSVEETKEMLEQALLVFVEEQHNPEFLTSYSIEELRKKFNVNKSELMIEIDKLINNVGTPISIGNGMIWQINVQNYLLNNPNHTKKLIKLFSKPLTKNEQNYLVNSYTETLPKILGLFKHYV